MLSISVINHLLGQSAETRFDLASHYGRCFVLSVLGVKTQAVINEQGFLDQTQNEAEVTITFLQSAVLKIAQGQTPSVGDVTITGDYDFGMALLPILGGLRYYFQDDAARVFGDVLANRMVQGLDFIKHGFTQGKKRIEENVSDFAFEQNAPFLHQQIFDAWAENVATLKDDVARLEARIKKMESNNKV